MEPAKVQSDRQAALVISIIVGGVVAVVTIATFWWIYYLAIVADPYLAEAAEKAAGPYDYNDGILAITQAEPNVPAEGDARSPWLGATAWQEAVQAGQDYITQYPQPQQVQVLTNMDTQQIWNYMQRMSAALGVSCQYCHDINNYAAYTYAQKTSGLLMLQLVQDVNAQYIVNLPNWRGNYVQCDTCHNNQAVGMPAVSEQFVESTPPIEVFLEPLDENGMPQRDPEMKLDLKEATLYYLYNYQVWDPYDASEPKSGRGSLSLTHPGGRTQDQVTINQNVMNLMTWAQGVGCTYCHNSRNFYAYEADIDAPQFTQQYAVNRLKSQQMLLMTTWMAENWSTYVLPNIDVQPGGVNEPASLPLNGRQYYVTIDDLNYSVPGCYTCHRNNAVPKAAINATDIPAGDEGLIVFPPQLTGVTGTE